MGGSRHNGFRASQVLHVVVLFLQSVSLRSRKRTFSERYLRVIKLRNFESIRRSRNEASMPRCIIPICECVSVRILRICHYIIRDWRGLAELLISMERQCEGLIWWDKQESFSHVFFVSITVVLTLMPKQGEW
jgi:hypothetical protein